MQRLIDDANAWGAANGKASDLTIDSFSDVVTAIEQIQEKQGVAGTTQKEALSTIEGSMTAFKSSWQNLVTEIGKPDADIGARIRDMLSAVLGEGGEGGLLNNVTAEVGTIAHNIVQGFGTALGMGFDWLVANAPTIVSDAMGRLTAAISGAVASMQGGGPDIVGMLFGEGGIASRIAGLVTSIGAAVQANAPALIAALSALGPTVLQALGGIAMQAYQWLITQGPTIATNAAQAFLGLVQGLTAQGPTLMDNLGQMLLQAVDWLIANGPAILQAALQAFAGIGQAIIDHGPEILKNIGDTIGRVITYVALAAGKLLGAAVKFLGGLITGTSQEGQKLREWFANLPQTLLNAMGDLGSFLLQAGKDLIGGFVKGITDIGSTVTDAVKGVADDAIGGIKGFLGIASPSKVMMRIGGETVEGLDIGIDDSARDVSRTMAGVGSMMTDALGQAYARRRAVPAYAPRSAAASGGGWAGVESAVNGLRGDMGQIGIYLDGNVLVGHTATRMDKALAVV